MRINIINDVQNYIPKLYHNQIFYNFEAGKWEWLPYAQAIYKDVMSNNSDKDYYISGSQLGNIICQSRKEDSICEMIFIKNNHGFFMIKPGTLEAVNLRKYKTSKKI